jgi:hypothetical protein
MPVVDVRGAGMTHRQAALHHSTTCGSGKARRPFLFSFSSVEVVFRL